MGYRQNLGAELADIMHNYSCDLLFPTLTYPWTNASINSGIASVPSSDVKHPGVLGYKSTTVADSGYLLRLGGTCITLGGGEKSTFIFKTASTLTGITRRMGFHNTTTIAIPSAGVYAKISDGVLAGQTVNNSTISSTISNYTLSPNTWYRLKIELNADATKATFTLYADNSDVVLWTDTLSSNIPVATAMGHGDICTYSGTTSIDIGLLDYIDIILPNIRRVV
jgi:hypothetical protein